MRPPPLGQSGIVRSGTHHCRCAGSPSPRTPTPVIPYFVRTSYPPRSLVTTHPPHGVESPVRTPYPPGDPVNRSDSDLRREEWKDPSRKSGRRGGRGWTVWKVRVVETLQRAPWVRGRTRTPDRGRRREPTLPGPTGVSKKDSRTLRGASLFRTNVPEYSVTVSFAEVLNPVVGPLPVRTHPSRRRVNLLHPHTLSAPVTLSPLLV